MGRTWEESVDYIFEKAGRQEQKLSGIQKAKER